MRMGRGIGRGDDHHRVYFVQRRLDSTQTRSQLHGGAGAFDGHDFGCSVCANAHEWLVCVLQSLGVIGVLNMRKNGAKIL